MTQYHDRHTMERLREHLIQADNELRDAQHFLNPTSAEEAEVELPFGSAAPSRPSGALYGPGVRERYAEDLGGHPGTF